MIGNNRDEFDRFLLGPAWRHHLALEAAREARLRIDAEMDPMVRDATQYLRLAMGGREALAAKNHPEIAAAECMHHNAPVSHHVELLLLAGGEAKHIADRLNLEPDTVEVYAKLYFDVRPMLSSTARIHASVILAAEQRGEYDAAADFRIAYFGGPFAAEALIKGKTELPLDQITPLSDAAIALHAKAQTALGIPLNPLTSMKFMRMYLEWQIEDKRLDVRRQELALEIERWAFEREERESRCARDSQLCGTADAKRSEPNSNFAEMRVGAA